MSQRLFVLCICCCCSLGKASAVNLIDRILNWVDSADVQGCDTSYVRLAEEGFVAYTSILSSASGLHAAVPSSEAGGPMMSGFLRTPMTASLSVGLKYRGWGLSYSHGLLSHPDTDFSFDFNSQRYGIEYLYHDSYALNGSLFSPDGQQQLDWPQDARRGRYRTTMVNAFWFLEHQHYSNPAATIHTTYQLKSCGSWLLSMSYWHGSYRSYLDEHLPYALRRISLSHISIGGGYAYNTVFGHKHCLLQTSLTPMIVCWHRDRLYHQDRVQSLSRGASVDVVGRMNFVYNYGRYLCGFQNVLNYFMSPFDQGSMLHTFDWEGRCFVGLRF